MVRQGEGSECGCILSSLIDGRILGVLSTDAWVHDIANDVFINTRNIYNRKPPNIHHRNSLALGISFVKSESYQ